MARLPVPDLSMAHPEAAEPSSYESIDEWPADVQSLFDATEATNMQCGPIWYRHLVGSVFAGNPVRFHVLRKHGRPVAAIALLERPGAPLGQVDALSNFYTCLYAPALAPEATVDDVADLLRAIVRSHAGLATLRLAPMDRDAPAFGLLMAALRRAGLRPYSFFCFGNWYLPVRQSWATYLAARDGATRSTLKRMSKRFSAQGGTLEIITAGERLAAGMAAYQKVYAASWKIPEPFPDFMPGLIRLCAERGWLRLGVAWLGEEAIAAQMWIVASGRADIYKLAYDENFKALSPGTLLTALLMERAIDIDHVTEVDYLIGDDPYKKAWMTERRERWGIVAYNPATWRGCTRIAREVLGRGARSALGHWRAACRPRDAAAEPRRPASTTALSVLEHDSGRRPPLPEGQRGKPEVD